MCAAIDAALDDKQIARFSVLQIKEKYGGLRIYWQFGATRDVAIDLRDPSGLTSLTMRGRKGKDEAVVDLLRKLVSEAQSRSLVTCEECGRQGRRRDDAWIRTLCDDHAAQRSGNL